LQCLVTRNGLDSSGPDIVAAAARLVGPKLLDVGVFRRIEAFDETICEQCPRLARQSQGFGELFDS
jgi:hypothetical protein